MKLRQVITAFLCMVVPAAAYAGTCAPETLPEASVNALWSEAFAKQSGPGWIGGDSTYSTRLPDGRTVFVFSDTFIGTAKPDGTSAIKGMPHNSLLVGMADSLASVYSGTYDAPKSLIPERKTDTWFWAFATYIEKDKQLVFINEFDAGNVFGHFTGTSGMAVLDIPKGGVPQFSHTVLLPSDANTAWGRAILQEGEYLYAYGANSDPDKGTFYGMKVARIPQGKSTQTESWRYWNGEGWVDSLKNARTVYSGNELNGVMKQPAWMGKGYMAVSIPWGVFHDTVLQLSFACDPQGPWSKPETVYTLPEITGPQAYKNQIAYLPTFHPGLGDADTVVASYNINTTNGLKAYLDNIHIYQPRFLTLRKR